ncbi:MAG: hypothetical protein IKX95_02390, partial [Lachnospiraceae bacterium]|nr:hypothetical protein [Lachnospiraceae bacterium]
MRRIIRKTVSIILSAAMIAGLSGVDTFALSMDDIGECDRLETEEPICGLEETEPENPGLVSEEDLTDMADIYDVPDLTGFDEDVPVYNKD